MPEYTPPPPELVPGSIVWAYLRDSGGPTQDRSVTQQREVIEDYCRQYGLNLAQVFADVHKSGTSDETREQFHALLQRADHEPPQALLIWSFARFARNELDSQFYKATLRKKGILIHSLIDDLPGGKYQIAFEAILDVANAEKAAQAAWESRRGLQAIVKQGAMMGHPPRGFKKEAFTTTSNEGTVRTYHRWVPDPVWVPRVQQAFAMRAAGSSLIEINNATQLYGGINSYRSFWTNELYLGILRYGELTIPNYCEPLIDLATWQAVKNVSAHFAKHANLRSKTHHPRSISSNYLLSGLVRCGRCGAPLWGHSTKKKNGDIQAYRCTRGVRRRDCDLPHLPSFALEQGVILCLCAEFLEPESYILTYRAAKQQQAQRLTRLDEQRKQTQSELTGVLKQIDNITITLSERPNSPALLKRLDLLETRENELKNTLSEIKHAVENPLADVTDEQLAAAAYQLIDKLQSGTLSEKRTIIRGFVKEIVMDRREDRLIGTITIYTETDHPPPHGLSTSRLPLAAPRYTQTIDLHIQITKKPMSH